MTRPLGWFAAAIIMLGSPPSISAQAPVDSARLERVMALGKLWGMIGLFHPYLAYRNINWDSALVVALPLAERATNREEYAAAVRRMLVPLGDPATRVIEPTPPAQPLAHADSAPVSRWLADSVLLVDFGVIAASGLVLVLGNCPATVRAGAAVPDGTCRDPRFSQCSRRS